MRAIFTELYRCILAFPVVVTLLASIALICGGVCSGWQWYLAFVLVAADITVRRGLRQGFIICVFFAAFLMALWAFSACGWTNGWNDTIEYHLPGVRMLIEGWNPVYEATPEAMMESTGVAPTTLRIFHVLFMEKGAWIFTAVAYYFVHDPFNLFFPLYVFLMLGAAGALWRFMGAVHIIWKSLAVIVLWFTMPNSDFLIDAVVGYAGVGLLCSLGNYWRTRSWDWIPLLVFSFWMCVSKQTGMLQCFIFWAVMGIAFLVRERQVVLRRLGGVVAFVLIVVAVVCASPFITSTIHYGHPLYPQYSGDSVRYPTYEITGDFITSNEDAAAMGYWGYLLNAYVSTGLVQWYYAWRFDRQSFSPRAHCWQAECGNSAHADSPTVPRVRLAFCSCLCLILFFGDGASRLMALAVVAGVMAFPGVMLGYLRYVAWFVILIPLAVDGLGRVQQKWVRRSLLTMLTVSLLIIYAKEPVMSSASRIAKNNVARHYLTRFAPSELFVTYPSTYLADPFCITNHFAPFGNRYQLSKANLQLLCRESEALQSAQIIEIDPKSKDAADMLSSHPYCFSDESFRIADAALLEKQLPQYMQDVKSGILTHRESLVRFPCYWLECWLCIAPKLVFDRVVSIFR